MILRFNSGATSWNGMTVEGLETALGAYGEVVRRDSKLFIGETAVVELTKPGGSARHQGKIWVQVVPVVKQGDEDVSKAIESLRKKRLIYVPAQ